MGEISDGQPIFPGESEVDQLYIVQVSFEFYRRSYRGYYSILSLFCFMWSGALDSSRFLLSYPIISLASPMTNILISPLTHPLSLFIRAQKIIGPLTTEHLELFMANPRFAGLKFPDMSKPETLQKKYVGKLSKRALTFLNGLLTMEVRCVLVSKARPIFASTQLQLRASIYIESQR